MRRGVALLLASAPDPADDADVVEALERAKGGSRSGSGSERDKRNKAKASSSVMADAAVASAARAAASAAAAHLMSYPPLALTSGRPGASAAAAVASPGAQKALSALERVASRFRESSGVEGNKTSFASAARLRVAALRAALAAAEEESAATGALSLGAWRRCSGIFASLSSLWAHARDAEAEAERDAHELFRRRVKGPTAAEALEADDEATEAIAYERAFGRHGVAFADLQTAPDAVETLGDDADVDENLKKRNAAMKRLAREAGEDVGDDSEDEGDDDDDDETKAQTHAAKIAGLLEGDLLEEVVAAHRRLLGGLRGPPAPPPPPPPGSTDPAVAAAAAADPGGWWAVSGAKPAPKKYGGTLFTPEEATRAERFERAHDAGVRVAVACGVDAISSPAVAAAAATGALLRAALECAAAARPAVSAAEDDAAPRLHLIGVADSNGNGMNAYGDDAAGDDDASLSTTRHDPAADAAADALGADLNEGGCAGEMALVVAPVAATRAKITALLVEWPDHPLLSQLAEICDRVLQLPLSSPLKQALTGLELLLARAQTWEEGAAAHVSLKDQLALCAKLALRWRQRELRTWPRLLARAQERHVARAHRAWFALHRLLRPPRGKKTTSGSAEMNFDAEMRDAEEAGKVERSKVFDDPANLRGVDASGLTSEEREGLRQVTLALEEYVQGSTIGEFRARLDLLWQFHADMAVEAEARAAEGLSRGDEATRGDFGGGATTTTTNTRLRAPAAVPASARCRACCTTRGGTTRSSRRRCSGASRRRVSPRRRSFATTRVWPSGRTAGTTR
jgi:midasin